MRRPSEPLRNLARAFGLAKYGNGGLNQDGLLRFQIFLNGFYAIAGIGDADGVGLAQFAIIHWDIASAGRRFMPICLVRHGLRRTLKLPTELRLPGVRLPFV